MNIYYASKYGSDYNDGLTKVSPKTFQGAADMCETDFDVVVAMTDISCPPGEFVFVGRNQPYGGTTCMLGYDGQTEWQIVEQANQIRLESIPPSEDPVECLENMARQIIDIEEDE